jgi:hypothetical protein
MTSKTVNTNLKPHYFIQDGSIEQLLKELAQVNADGLALANRKNELLGILNLRLNPYGYRLED